MSTGAANTAAAISPWVSAFKGIGDGAQNMIAAKDEYGVSDSSNAAVAVGGFFNPREQTTEAFRDISKGNFDKDTALNLAAPFLGAIKTNQKNKEEKMKVMSDNFNQNIVQREKGMTFGLGGTHKKFTAKNPGDILEYKGDLHSDNSGGIEQKEITVEDGENEVIGENVINSNSIKFTSSVIAMLKEQGIDVTKYEGLTPAEAVMKEVRRYNNRTSDNRFVKNALDREKANGKGRYAISNASDVLGSMLNPSTPNYQGSGDNASEGLESAKNDQLESGFENNMPEPQMNPEGAANGMAFKKGGKYNPGEEYDLTPAQIKELEKQGYILSY